MNFVSTGKLCFQKSELIYFYLEYNEVHFCFKSLEHCDHTVSFESEEDAKNYFENLCDELIYRP